MRLTTRFAVFVETLGRILRPSAPVFRPLHPDPLHRWLIVVALLLLVAIGLPPVAWGESGIVLTAVAVLGFVAWATFLEQRRSRSTASYAYREAGRIWPRYELRLGGLAAWIIMVAASILLLLPYAIMYLSSLLLPVPDVTPRTLTPWPHFPGEHAQLSNCIAGDRTHIDALVKPASKWDDRERTAAERLAACTLIQVTASPDGPEPDFHLSVLQFCENGSLIQARCQDTAPPRPGAPVVVSRQTEALLDLLKRNRESLVVVYVHGWRHDDRRGDDDLRRTSILASYSAAFVRSRQFPGTPAAGATAPRNVVAVYIGWRGNQLASDDGGLGATLLAALTFPARKRASETAAPQVVAVLRHIQGYLASLDGDLPANSPRGNRMLVIGHSAGGNLLMSGLEDQMSEALTSRIRSGEWGQPLRGPLGDLTVLINPASEASRWTAVQRKFYHDLSGLAGPLRTRIDAPSCRQLGCLFGNHQPPTVMSITAGAAALSDKERAERLSSLSSASLLRTGIRLLPTSTQDRLLVVSDWVTEFVFPISQAVFSGRWFDAADRSTIGHFSEPAPADHLRPQRPFQPAGSSLGRSHLMEINGRVEGTTSFEASRSLIQGQCEPDSSWLWYARVAPAGLSTADFDRQRERLARSPLNVMNIGWDGNHAGKKVKSFGVIQRSPNFLNAQYVHYPERPRSWNEAERKYLQPQPVRISPVPPAFPFWNVAALDSVLEDHGRFISYPLWCSLNQFVLDRPAQPPTLSTRPN